MSSEVEVYLPNLRGSAVTVGKRTHILLHTRWQPRWSEHLKLETNDSNLGSDLIGLLAAEKEVEKSS